MRILSQTNDIQGYHGTVGTPTNIVEPVGPYVCGNSEIWKKQAAKGVVYGKAKSAKHRSKTFEGIARAMAEQWGNHPTEKGDEQE